MTKYNLERTAPLVHQLDIGLKSAHCDYLFSIVAGAWCAGVAVYGASVWAVRDCGMAGFLTGTMLYMSAEMFASCIKPHRFYCHARDLRKHVLAADSAPNGSVRDHYVEQSEAAFERLMNS